MNTSTQYIVVNQYEETAHLNGQTVTLVDSWHDSRGIMFGEVVYKGEQYLVEMDDLQEVIG